MRKLRDIWNEYRRHWWEPYMFAGAIFLAVRFQLPLPLQLIYDCLHPVQHVLNANEYIERMWIP